MVRVFSMVASLLTLGASVHAQTLGDAIDRYNAKVAFNGFLSGELAEKDDSSGQKYVFSFDQALENFYVVSYRNDEPQAFLSYHEGVLEAYLTKPRPAYWDLSSLEQSALTSIPRLLYRPFWGAKDLTVRSEEAFLAKILCDKFLVPTEKGSTAYWFSKDGLLRRIADFDTQDRVVMQLLFPSYSLTNGYALPLQRYFVGYYGKMTQETLSHVRVVDAEAYLAAKEAFTQAFAPADH